ncbi:phage distal tail protein [Streptomyces antarcticus]|uniref:phage distal tail protein n=1 Tax=Streptomyces antarcticus TaxID=2996458 RepID=UPI00226DECA4|nr:MULTISPECIES: phage tail domain-containing protein [unclassified Streptomyces]MCY0942605.1 phage tail family protein [Streptomyces sp. H34-AA3]MCZ4081351.1 phage tail family protein [Streptomyces sp. H34-S5]
MAIGSLITSPGQVQYGDLLLGTGTPYRWRSISGWEDLPALDSGSVARSDAHGAFPGLLLAQARTVGLDGLIIRAPRERIGAVVGVLNAGTVPRVDELPLVVWLDDRGPLLVYARAVRRSIPAGPGYRLGTIVGGAVEWVASDPRRYKVAEQSAAASLPTAEPGLSWPLVWPMGFGAPGSSGALTAVNTGDAETHPIVEFRGPVTAPALTNINTGDVLEYDIPLAAGDVLTVDTRAGTVLLNGGASRLYSATSRSVPEQTFTLAPGANNFAFRAGVDSDPAATATVRYRSAYW